jgi:hypothetical protein
MGLGLNLAFELVFDLNCGREPRKYPHLRVFGKWINRIILYFMLAPFMNRSPRTSCFTIGPAMILP